MVIVAAMVLIFSYFIFSNSENSTFSLNNFSELVNLDNFHKARISAPVIMKVEQLNRSAFVGDELEVAIIIDPAGHLIDGVDVVLAYDAEALEFVDGAVVSVAPGLRIIPGRNADGILKLSALLDSEAGKIEKGEWLRMKFKILQHTNKKLELIFKEDNTGDCNAAFKGKDILSGVIPLNPKIKKM